ncbi:MULTISPECIES: hypothetical protein [Photorhabdus]|uniref:Transmembrane protein n=1 Tax=Photorhabdus kayaii TaxID=230088 RepID=A0ABX0AYP6_9GAMM|nr:MULTISPECIES: hypothetical protein [Photorhabdus]MCC8374628.1 hypothetical protein [Photorhabdus bodei]MCT8352485.1 hypothetical protein [Photorhabdus kayaii]MDB6366484.1 hypothetical protein [Photorhabdus bodei]NDL12199.1 hypothetical protein [Photorhabdus kayaii]NDL25725.1 hypothetical protein [Photorhabdus kayaii]
MTGVSECSQQRGNLKDDGYNYEKQSLDNHHVLIYSVCNSYLLVVIVSVMVLMTRTSIDYPPDDGK